MSEPTTVNGDEERRDGGAEQPTAQIRVETIKDLVGSLDEEGKKALAAELVGDVFPAEARRVVVREAMKTAPEAAIIAAEAVRVAPAGAKESAAVEAVKTAPDVNKANIAAAAVRSLPSDEAKREVARQFLPIDGTTANEVWLMVVGTFRWVLWGATLALVAAIGVALFREVDQAYVQILLTVFTTVAGIFAGFITGKALGSSTGP